MDISLPLRWIFLDLNSYFASVEQAVDPKLRGRPVGVGATMSSGGTIIAASYEAKAYGVKTGTRVGEATSLCPDIVLLPARHSLYLHTHHQILKAVENVLPIHKVHSVDEMSFKLLGEEREPEQALKLAKQLKESIQEQVAPNLTSSVGIATNSFLAKFGTEMQKPDGLVMIQQKDLPNILFDKPLMMFTGINKRMKRRLNAAGIFTSEQMVTADKKHITRAFGSVIGEHWYYLLRGHDMAFEKGSRKSLGHSHVLAPEMRSDVGCRAVMLRLLCKATARLRDSKLWANKVAVGVNGKGKSWSDERGMDATQDTHRILSIVLEMWEERDYSQPMKVWITFTSVVEENALIDSLFSLPHEDKTPASHAIDNMNQKFGKHTIYLGSMETAREHAPERIAFDKTTLFKEGKGDHEWKDNQLDA